MVKRKNPCYVDGKDCERRCPGCSAKCPEWQEYLIERNAGYKKAQKKREDNRYWADMKYKISRRHGELKKAKHTIGGK